MEKNVFFADNIRNIPHYSSLWGGDGHNKTVLPAKLLKIDQFLIFFTSKNPQWNEESESVNETKLRCLVLV